MNILRNQDLKPRVFNKGYEDYDESARLPPHIETRIAREKPCRTLFVRNVQVNPYTPPFNHYPFI